MAEVAGSDPAGAGVASAAQGVDQDICEVERLLALSERPVIAHRLAVFLSELQQVTAPVAWSLSDVAISHIVLVPDNSELSPSTGSVGLDAILLTRGACGVSSGAHLAEGMHVKDDRVIISAGESHVAVARDPMCSLEVTANARWTLVIPGIAVSPVTSGSPLHAAPLLRGIN